VVNEDFQNTQKNTRTDTAKRSLFQRRKWPPIIEDNTIWYDTMRYTIFTCAQKLTSSQLNLPHGTRQKRLTKKLLKKQKPRCLEKNGPVVKSVESDHEAGRESMVGKICERGRFWAGMKDRRRCGWWTLSNALLSSENSGIGSNVQYASYFTFRPPAKLRR